MFLGQGAEAYEPEAGGDTNGTGHSDLAGFLEDMSAVGGLI